MEFSFNNDTIYNNLIKTDIIYDIEYVKLHVNSSVKYKDNEFLWSEKETERLSKYDKTIFNSNCFDANSINEEHNSFYNLIKIIPNINTLARLLLNNFNNNGCYGVFLFYNSKWNLVIIDDYILFDSSIPNYIVLIYKAVVKHYGSEVSLSNVSFNKIFKNLFGINLFKLSIPHANYEIFKRTIDDLHLKNNYVMFKNKRNIFNRVIKVFQSDNNSTTLYLEICRLLCLKDYKSLYFDNNRVSNEFKIEVSDLKELATQLYYFNYNEMYYYNYLQIPDKKMQIIKLYADSEVQNLYISFDIFTSNINNYNYDLIYFNNDYITGVNEEYYYNSKEFFEKHTKEDKDNQVIIRIYIFEYSPFSGYNIIVKQLFYKKYSKLHLKLSSNDHYIITEIVSNSKDIKHHLLSINTISDTIIDLQPIRNANNIYNILEHKILYDNIFKSKIDIQLENKIIFEKGNKFIKFKEIKYPELQVIVYILFTNLEIECSYLRFDAEDFVGYNPCIKSLNNNNEIIFPLKPLTQQMLIKKYNFRNDYNNNTSLASDFKGFEYCKYEDYDYDKDEEIRAVKLQINKKIYKYLKEEEYENACECNIF